MILAAFLNVYPQNRQYLSQFRAKMPLLTNIELRCNNAPH